MANQTAVGLEEGRADRAPHRREHRQGHVRGARRRLGPDGGGQGDRGALRPQPPPRLPAREPGARGGADETPWPELAAALQSRLRRLYRRAFFDARHDALRALVPLPALDKGAVEQLRRSLRGAGRRAVGQHRAIGRRPRRRGSAAPDARGGRRRAHRPLAGRRAAAPSPTTGWAPTATSSTSSSTRRPRDRYGQAVAALIDYDRDRNARLVDTLERYLAARCSVAASARALYIHPNTVRQRLERIQQVTGLDLQGEDLLSLELALKVARLQRVREEPAR